MDMENAAQLTMIIHASSNMAPSERIEKDLSARRIHRKSKKGCVNCKQRHVKCNEERPACSACIRLELSCSYQTPNKSGHASENDPLAPNQNTAFDHLDLEVMHHWATCSCVYIPTEHRRQIWAKDVGKLAFSFDYLLFQLMAVSGIHLMRDNPKKDELAQRVQTYRNKALDFARPALRQMTTESHVALFAFAGLTMIFSFAEIALRKEQDGSSYDPILHLIECLRLNNGIPIILESDRANFPKSWASDLINMTGQTDFERLALSGRSFDGLPMLYRLIDEHEATAESRQECRQALSLLLDIIQILIWTPEEHDSSHLIHTWTTSLGETFWQRLQSQAHVSLMIIAYFAAMISLRPKLWWFQDWPRLLMNQIDKHLVEPEWNEALRWPKSIIAHLDAGTS